MGCDLDMKNLKVVEELTAWGKWYLDTVPVDGVRLDAVKHIDFTFFEEWLKAMDEHESSEADLRQDIAEAGLDQQIGGTVVRRRGAVDQHQPVAAVVADQSGRRIDDQRCSQHDQHIGADDRMITGTGGLGGIHLLQQAGYDALAIGNNEFFAGAQCLENMSSR